MKAERILVNAVMIVKAVKMVVKASRVLVGRQSASLLHEIEMVSSGCVSALCGIDTIR